MPVSAMMSVRLHQEITDEELNQLNTELLAADIKYLYKHNNCYAYLREYWYTNIGIPPLSRVPAGDYDDVYPDIPIKKTSTGRDWLTVNLSDEHYDPGYARGVGPLHMACAEWLEQHLPGCEVWYGNDSNDHYRPYGPAERALLMEFFNKSGHRTYDEKIRTPESDRLSHAYYDQSNKALTEPPWCD